MEISTQDGYITHRPRDKKNQPSFMIKRIMYNPTILALELWKWRELYKMVASRTEQYTKCSGINFHDYAHQA